MTEIVDLPPGIKRSSDNLARVATGEESASISSGYRHGSRLSLATIKQTTPKTPLGDPLGNRHGRLESSIRVLGWA